MLLLFHKNQLPIGLHQRCDAHFRKLRGSSWLSQLCAISDSCTSLAHFDVYYVRSFSVVRRPVFSSKRWCAKQQHIAKMSRSEARANKAKERWTFWGMRAVSSPFRWNFIICLGRVRLQISLNSHCLGLIYGHYWTRPVSARIPRPPFASLSSSRAGRHSEPFVALRTSCWPLHLPASAPNKII